MLRWTPRFRLLGGLKAYWCPAAGDTLFAMGCGRLFEGSPTQMWDSLSKIRALPPQTVVRRR